MSGDALPGPRVTLAAVVALDVTRLLVGLVVALPAARVLGSALATARTAGDRILVEPGAALLVESLRLAERPLVASLEASLVSLVLLGALGVLPLGFALASMARPGGSLRRAAALATARLPALTCVSAAGLVGTALALALGVALVRGAAGAAGAARDPRLPLLLGAAAGLPALLAVGAAGTVRDLARAAVVVRGARPGGALSLGVRLLATRPAATLGFGLALDLASLALVGAGALGAASLDAFQGGTGRLVAVTALHQAVLLGLVLLRLAGHRRALALASSADRRAQPAARRSRAASAAR